MDFVLRLPYLLHLKYIPCFLPINDAFECGEQSDGDRKFTWAPFTISEKDYGELVRAIRSRGAYEQIECPNWVRTGYFNW